ncbi:MAG TPA: hypothetical protein VFF41_00955 [Gallionella sp.]|nr:hypothetical protein [Gallionella sp.]
MTTNTLNPDLLAKCALIDGHFINETGPFGKFLAEEARTAWLASRRRMITTHLLEYITILSENIVEPEKKQGFVNRARKCVL